MRIMSFFLPRLILVLHKPLPMLKTRATLPPALRQHLESELLFLMQRTNVRHQRLNLILAERTLEGRHPALAVRNDLSEFRIGQFLDYRRSKVRNVHALSNRRASTLLAVAHCAFRPEHFTAGRAVGSGVGP